MFTGLIDINLYHNKITTVLKNDLEEFKLLKKVNF